jgi:hypothetical protein
LYPLTLRGPKSRVTAGNHSYSLKFMPRYWKIAPGESAWQWDEARDGAFIAIGWSELGDISGISEDEFDRRAGELLKAHPDWGSGIKQVWTFAHIEPGDHVVANQGITKVLGIGSVTGPYFYVPNERYAHRLPVNWTDVRPRQVNEPGWRRALIELEPSKFSAILDDNSPALKASARAWLFQANPTTYDIAAAIRNLPEQTWVVRQHRADVHAGDTVYLWQSGAGGGLIARASTRSLIQAYNA